MVPLVLLLVWASSFVGGLFFFFVSLHHYTCTCAPTCVCVCVVWFRLAVGGHAMWCRPPDSTRAENISRWMLTGGGACSDPACSTGLSCPVRKTYTASRSQAKTSTSEPVPSRAERSRHSFAGTHVRVKPELLALPLPTEYCSCCAVRRSRTRQPTCCSCAVPSWRG